MKKIIVSFVSATALVTVGMAAASNSMAASDQAFSVAPSTSSCIYVEGNVGYGKVNAKQTPGTNSFSNTGFTWNGNLGYQFAKYFAIEAGYTSFSNVKETAGSDTVTVTPYGVDLLAKGILPLNSQFSVFAKAGAMYLHTVASVAGLSAYRYNYVPEFAVGTEYYVTQNIDVALEAVATLGVKAGSGNEVAMPQTYAGYVGMGYKFNM